MRPPFRSLKLPVRVVCVSDASLANKQSSYATEGICILLAEDALVSPETDARDFLKEAQVAWTGGSMHLLHCSSTERKGRLWPASLTAMLALRIQNRYAIQMRTLTAWT